MSSYLKLLFKMFLAISEGTMSEIKGDMILDRALETPPTSPSRSSTV